MENQTPMATTAPEKPMDMTVDAAAPVAEATQTSVEVTIEAPAAAPTTTPPTTTATTTDEHATLSKPTIAARQPTEAPAVQPTPADDVMSVDVEVAAEPVAETTAPVTTAPENVGMADSHVTDALEAALAGVFRSPTTQTTGAETTEGAEGASQEWEVDSNPYASSDSDSSDSSDSDSDSDSDTEMVGNGGVTDTVRMMMASAIQDLDDDDEVTGGPGGEGVLRSKNEAVETAPPKPEIVLAADDEIVNLGSILHIVGDTAVIQGKTDGAYRVIDAGSLLCKADRQVVGIVADVIGNVRMPMYVLRYAHADDLAKDGLEAGQDLFYAPKHAHFVFTDELRNIKGSDASNLHDEEVGQEEAEFSDDEKEAAFKRDLKAKRRGANKAARGGGQDDKSGRGGRGGKRGGMQRNESGGTGGSGSNGGLQYDDEDDGPYRPLARPANFGQGLPTPITADGSPNGGSMRGSDRRLGGRGGAPGTRGNFRGSARGRGGSNYSQQPINSSGSSNYYSSNAPGVPPPPFYQPQQAQQHQNQQAAPSPFPPNVAQMFAQLAQGQFPPPPPPQWTGFQNSAPPAHAFQFQQPPPPPQQQARPPPSQQNTADLLNNPVIQQLLQAHQQQQQQQVPQMQPPPAYPFQFQAQQQQQPNQQPHQQQPPSFPNRQPQQQQPPSSFQQLFPGNNQGRQ